MALTKHGQYLWKFTRLAFFNSYLVEEEDGLTAVDTGLPGSAKQIMAAAEQIGKPIKRIVITHAHGDHVASLDALVEMIPDVEVYTSARTADFLAGHNDLKPDEVQTPIKGGLQATKTKPQIVAHGDQVGSLEFIASPGHTPDHTAFYDVRDGSLIAGDAMQTQGGLAVAGVVRWLFPFPGLATWHLPTAAASAKVLVAKQPSRLAVGHGPILENPVSAMQDAIQTAEKKIG